MSDEAHMESAYRHADVSRRLPWHGMAPDEEAMAHEEAMELAEAHSREDEREERCKRRGAAQQALMTYLFAGAAGAWIAVAMRALAVMRLVMPGALSGRSINPEITAMLQSYEARRAGAVGRFNLGDLRGLVDNDRETLRRLLEFLFPPGTDWLRDGCRRTYLVAMVFQPFLIKPAPSVVTFEDLAQFFGELDGTHPDERARARSRWSARGKVLLRQPMEAGGESVPALFGKNSEVRGKYKAAAAGNSNRKNKIKKKTR